MLICKVANMRSKKSRNILAMIIPLARHGYESCGMGKAIAWVRRVWDLGRTYDLRFRDMN